MSSDDMQNTDATESALPGLETVELLRPSWLHPLSLLFELISHLRRYLIPAAIAVFYSAQGSSFGLIFACIIFVPALLSSVIHYFTLRYQIQGRDLIVSEGLFFRRVRTVPVARIQNIDLVQNVLHRLFNVAEVRLETASGTKPEATLRVLSTKQVDQLRRGVFEKQSLDEGAKTQTGAADDDAKQAATAPATRLLEIPTDWLVRAGLASNRGMLLVGILVGAYFQFDLEDRFSLEELGKFVPQNLGTAVIVSGAIAAILLALILLRLFGIVWYILRFHGYRLELHGEDLRISCGLLTKVSATVPRKRIQFISIHRTLFMKWMGFAAIRIETAGGGGSENENATTTVSRRWFIPVIKESQVNSLIDILRPDILWDETSLDWKPLAEGAKKRLMRIAAVMSVLLTIPVAIITASWGIGWYSGIVALPVFMPLFIAFAIKKSKTMRYARTDYGVVYRSGILNRKTSATFFEKIQTLRVDQSPFDRRWRMATFSVDTAAAGPAEHRISIPYLDEQFARDEYEQVVHNAALHEPVYG